MNLNEYRVLDCGNKQKLEQAGPYRIIRPALNAFWKPALPQKEWDMADATYIRDSSGSGHWYYRNKLPEEWTVDYAGFKLLLKPTGFGHLGFFAEQYNNWNYFRNIKNELGISEVNALNLFGYSGLGTMAMAQGGCSACHLDAAKGMVDWGREIRKLNEKTVPDRIRWIVDDVIKFTNREVRRNSKYNLIALDPPSFGRGSSGQVWKIEDDLPKLLSICNELLDHSKPFSVVLSCHSPGFSPIVLENMLAEAFGTGTCKSMEMTVPTAGGRLLPCGISSTFTKIPR